MEMVDACNICGQDIARYTCSMCGRNVCRNHFDNSSGLCIACKQGKKANM